MFAVCKRARHDPNFTADLKFKTNTSSIHDYASPVRRLSSHWAQCPRPWRAGLPLAKSSPSLCAYVPCPWGLQEKINCAEGKESVLKQKIGSIQISQMSPDPDDCLQELVIVWEIDQVGFISLTNVHQLDPFVHCSRDNCAMGIPWAPPQFLACLPRSWDHMTYLADGLWSDRKLFYFLSRTVQSC